MKNILVSIAVVATLVFSKVDLACAQNIAVTSASTKIEEIDNSFDFRVQNLRNFLLKYNSPLVEYADEFVLYADENSLDYRLVPAITGVESTFGKRIPINSYNAYGWANGEYKFTSWEDSISHVSEVLKEKYIDRGVVSVSQIAKVYAPPSSTWGKNVAYFIRKIDTLPLDFDIVI